MQWFIRIAILICTGLIALAVSRSIRTSNSPYPDLARSCNGDKPTLVMFYADWCGYCKQMQDGTFADKRVAARLAGYDTQHLDVDDPKIAEYALSTGKQGIPQTFIVNAECETISHLEGYRPPQEFLRWLDDVERQR